MWGTILHRPNGVRYSKTCRSPTNIFPAPIIKGPRRQKIVHRLQEPEMWNFSSPHPLLPAISEGGGAWQCQYGTLLWGYGQDRNTCPSIELAHFYCEFRFRLAAILVLCKLDEQNINSYHSSFYLICRSQIPAYRFVSVLLAPSNVFELWNCGQIQIQAYHGGHGGLCQISMKCSMVHGRYPSYHDSRPLWYQILINNKTYTWPSVGPSADRSV